MRRGAHQGVVPRGRGVVVIRARILGHVQPAPPQIQVQLVGVPRAGSETRHPQVGPRVSPFQPEWRFTRIETALTPGRLPRLSLCIRPPHPQPEAHLVPRSGLEGRLPQKGLRRSLQRRAVVVEGAHRERQDIRPVVRPQVGGAPADRIHQSQQPPRRRPQPLQRLLRPGLSRRRGQLPGPQRRLQHQALVVRAVLRIGPLRRNLLLQPEVQPLPAQRPPAPGLRVPGQAGGCGVQPGGLGQ